MTLDERAALRQMAVDCGFKPMCDEHRCVLALLDALEAAERERDEAQFSGKAMAEVCIERNRAIERVEAAEAGWQQCRMEVLALIKERNLAEAKVAALEQENAKLTKLVEMRDLRAEHVERLRDRFYRAFCEMKRKRDDQIRRADAAEAKVSALEQELVREQRINQEHARIATGGTCD